MCIGSRPWSRTDMKARDGAVMGEREHGDAGPKAAGVMLVMRLLGLCGKEACAWTFRRSWVIDESRLLGAR